MADEVRDVIKPLAKMAPGFKASMNGQWHKGKGEIRDPQNLNMCGSTLTARSASAAIRRP
jgi:predicted phage tail protein